MESTSDGSGEYVLGGLESAEYDIHIEAQGFRPFVMRGIEVTGNATIRADLTLVVGFDGCRSAVNCRLPRSAHDYDRIARRFYTGLREFDLRARALNAGKPIGDVAIVRNRTIVSSDRFPAWLAKRAPSGFEFLTDSELKKRAGPKGIVSYLRIDQIVDEDCCVAIDVGRATISNLAPDPQAMPYPAEAWSGFVFNVAKVDAEWLSPAE